MKPLRLLLFTFGLMLYITNWAQAGSNWSIGVSFGSPGYHRPWYPHAHRPYVDYYYYRPRPIYYQPPVVVRPSPIIVQDRPIIVEQSPAPSQSYQPPQNYQQPQTLPMPNRLDPGTANQATAFSPTDQQRIRDLLRLLSDTDDQVRGNAAIELGRMKAENAMDALAATLAGDRSPQVRETAARALGLIGSPRSLTALSYAAQADQDRDVRRSSQFAVEVIQANNRR